MVSGPQSLYTPTKPEIHETAQRVVSILRNRGLSCCLTGSTASSAWGASRTPKVHISPQSAAPFNFTLTEDILQDIDIVIMTRSHEEESIKRFIAADDPAFYLVSSTNPRNFYKIVWYRYPGRPGLAIKIDVLIPPTMSIPFVESDLIVIRNLLPLMPLLPQLLLKLQCWDDHRLSRYSDKRLKQYVDAQDVRELLIVANKRGVRVGSEKWLSAIFKMQGERRVKSYVAQYPDTRGAWSRIGFPCP